MARQPGEDVGEPGARVDAVELCRLDQRVHGGGPVAAGVGSREGPVASADRDAAKSALGRLTLLETQTRPSSRKRVKAGQRLST